MKTERFYKRSLITVPSDELYDWHGRPGALQRLTPPWETVSRIEQGPLSDGARSVFYLKAGPFSIPWVAEHVNCIPGKEFSDIQVRGPFSFWKHTHRFVNSIGRGCSLEDDIEYRLRLHPLSAPLFGPHIARRLARMFSYRHDVTARDTARAMHPLPLKIAVTGAGGMIGRNLVPLLTTRGHDVTVLSRGPSSPGGPSWDPHRSSVDYSFYGTDAVVHLAGEPLGRSPWTPTKKRAILESRVAGTRLLAETLAAMDKPPSSFLCASAIGYYGDRGDDIMTEDDEQGRDFISALCAEWEKAALPAVERGIRVVFLRIGIALHPAGGALKGFLAPARLGLAGPIGTGRQFISWISMEDLIGAIDHILVHNDIRGPVNLVAPSPARNVDFIRSLGRVLRRPAFLAVPAAAVRVALGQMGRELLLSSTRVSPQKLIDSGFRFLHENIEEALYFLLGRSPVD
ncbi:MAG: TIGR01777 family oxidoreductase [Spirochaetes bacterium]|nr:TIGR01777 family oxidoreductase [Spirochaetota bacterium]